MATILCITAALALSSQKDDVATIQARLAHYFQQIESLHLKYDGRRTKRLDPPKQPLLRQWWDESRDDSSKMSFRYEFWWRPPSQRLDVYTFDPASNPKEVITSYIIHNNRYVQFDKTFNAAQDQSAGGVGFMEDSPLKVIGRRVRPSLDTSTADLLLIPGVARMATDIELKAASNAKAGIIVGPGVPSQFCSGRFESGSLSMFFNSPSEVLPSRIDIWDPLTKPVNSVRQTPTPATHMLETHELKDFRQIKCDDGKIIEFPFEMRQIHPIVLIEWFVKDAEINTRITDDIFTSYRGQVSRIAADGKVPRLKTRVSTDNARIQSQAKRVREAEELLGVDDAVSHSGFIESKWLWMFGASLVGLGIGLVTLLRQGRNR